MKSAIGIFFVLVGGLGTVIATGYAIIVAMMSGFAEDPAALLLCCAAVPVIGVSIVCLGIKLLYQAAKPKCKSNNEGRSVGDSRSDHSTAI